MTLEGLCNPLDTLIGYQLRRASAAQMGSLAEALGALGLTPIEASVLLLIEANPGVTQSEVGRVLGVQRANMTPLAATLHRRGLLTRERVDGRSHGLRVTAAGAALGAGVLAVMRGHDARLLGRLPKGQRGAFARAVGLLWGSGTEG